MTTHSILVWKCIDNKSQTIAHYGKRNVAEIAVVLDAPVDADASWGHLYKFANRAFNGNTLSPLPTLECTAMENSQPPLVQRRHTNTTLNCTYPSCPATTVLPQGPRGGGDWLVTSHALVPQRPCRPTPTLLDRSSSTQGWRVEKKPKN